MWENSSRINLHRTIRKIDWGRNTMEDNGNSAVGLQILKPTSSSNEDLSEYTDADESISAPTEFLAEFLSAVMLKDYETALKYCKLILQYEPNNMTAKEFYPLIQEKLQQLANEEETVDSEEDNEGNNSSSAGTSSEGSDSESSSSDDSSEDPEIEEEEEGVDVEEQGSDKRSKGSSDGDATTGSYSSLEDDEAEIDQLAALAAKYQIDNMDLGNGNHKPYTVGSCLPMINKPDGYSGNTNGKLTLSPPSHKHGGDGAPETTSLFVSNSDSESPTEPVSLQTIAILRAKVVPQSRM